MPLVFERLDPSRHRRESFFCSDPALTAYLRTQAGQDVRRRLAACYLLCEQGESEIIGYYTLSAFSVELTALPAALTRRLPRYPQVPAALLGRLAVASVREGQGMGQRLLVDAIHRASSTELAVFALVVDAVDERAASIYAHYGFTPFIDRPLRLYLPLDQVRGMF